MSADKTSKTCPKSDEGVRSAVKPGIVVVGFGKAAIPVADQLRDALKHRARPGDNWEESQVNHLAVVVECSPMNGDCCEAANKFMRDVRKSDGYPVYSEIIGRKVAVLAIGKHGKVSGAAKVEEVLLKRGGCTRLLSAPSVGTLDSAGDVSKLPWTAKVCASLDHITELTHGGWPGQTQIKEDALPDELPAASPTVPCDAPDISGADTLSPESNNGAAWMGRPVMVAVASSVLLIGIIAVGISRRAR